MPVDSQPTLRFAKLTDKAFAPTKGSEKAAGFDLKSKGDRIAQLICERIYYPIIEEVPSLTETQRGAGGFGSTGNN
ncbi:CLUMA_CG012899, isoform A [Clunio marinus]|uniref:dUTP diphosphatase n=1 Tax=Clunio marinus TaxID=568069 RepID=A0A1J1IH90_9DIPT|nr:CLUMA_CG012899, isoform A [Clunio marinus]